MGKAGVPDMENHSESSPGPPPPRGRGGWKGVKEGFAHVCQLHRLHQNNNKIIIIIIIIIIHPQRETCTENHSEGAEQRQRHVAAQTASSRCGALSSGVQPVTCRPHAAQAGRERGPTQNRKLT